jgi:hypothetical protein
MGRNERRLSKIMTRPEWFALRKQANRLAIKKK